MRPMSSLPSNELVVSIGMGNGGTDAGYWVRQIESVELEEVAN